MIGSSAWPTCVSSAVGLPIAVSPQCIMKQPYDSLKHVTQSLGSAYMDFMVSSRPSKSQRQIICPMKGRIVNDPRELDTLSASTPVE